MPKAAAKPQPITNVLAERYASSSIKSIWSPTGRVEMVHIRQPVGIDARHQRDGGGDVRKILKIQQDAGSLCHGGQVQYQVRRPAGRHQPDHAVDKGCLLYTSPSPRD